MRLIAEALKDYGVREIAGNEDNPAVMKWFGATDQRAADWITDETPSCSAALCYWVEAAGMPSTRSVTARSWEKWGQLVDGEPMPGDVVVYWRESPESWKGHCGIVIRSDETGEWVLGANQNDMVCITHYDRRRLLCFRRWVDMPGTTERIINSITKSTEMESLRGWKTIVFMVLTAALAGVDSLTDFLNIPDWYYAFVVPAVGFILRFLTDGPVFGGKKPA